jgi:hypothetical protein
MPKALIVYFTHILPMADSWPSYWYGGVPGHRYPTRHAEKKRDADHERRFQELMDDLKHTIFKLREAQRETTWKGIHLWDIRRQLKELGYEKPEDFEENLSWELIQKGEMKFHTPEYWALKRKEPAQSDRRIFQILLELNQKFPTQHISRMCELSIDKLY